MSATIFAFPRRAAAETPVTTETTVDGTARLARALAALDAAVATQRAAVVAWRCSLGALQSSVDKLSESLATYRATLTRLGQDVAAVNGQARQLEAWADRVLAAERSKLRGPSDGI